MKSLNILKSVVEGMYFLRISGFNEQTDLSVFGLTNQLIIRNRMSCFLSHGNRNIRLSDMYKLAVMQNTMCLEGNY